jgi:hypothetical protein
LITFLTPEIATSVSMHVSFFYYHRLLCPGFCWERFCRLSLVDSTIRLHWYLACFYRFWSMLITVPLFNFNRISMHMLKCI